MQTKAKENGQNEIMVAFKLSDEKSTQLEEIAKAAKALGDALAAFAGESET